MFSIRRWFMTKMLAQLTPGPNGGNGPNSGRGSGGRNNPFFPTNASSSSNGGSRSASGLGSSLMRFYYADEELNMIASELDSFDGRKDPARCTNLVNQLRSAQDKVICLLFQLMDEWNCKRADRDYRLKFPDDLVAGGENGESLNGQVWFGAECLAAGSNIMNHEAESEMLRPMAKKLTNRLDHLRMELRQALTDIDTSFLVFSNQLSLGLTDKMEKFDLLFATFEYEYVKAMLPIKTADEIEKLHELTVLFSETVSSALKRSLIQQEDLEECQPHVLIAIPRLAIIFGLNHCSESPIYRPQKDQLSTLFKPFHSLLHRVRELITALRPVEVEVLEKMLTNEESVHSSVPPTPTDQLLGVELVQEGKQNLHSKNERGSVKHRRRHSDPTSRRSTHYICSKANETCTTSTSQEAPTPNSLRQSVSALSLVPAIIDSPLGVGAKSGCASSEQKPDSACRSISVVCARGRSSSNRNYSRQTSGTVLSTSCHSIETSCSTSSTIDSFELALAVAAKSSPFISPGTRQLLHRLFITIAGVADQLQSNCANDLRIILRQVFKMHTESSAVDNVSVEEALEAKEESSGNGSGGSGGSSTTTSSANTPTDNSDSLWPLPPGPFSLPDSPQHHNHGRSRDLLNTISSDEHIDEEIDPILIAPVWVADELVSNCNSCGQSFNLIRRRHHCRNCGHIYCNQCSSHFVPLTQFGYNRPVRVCDLCFRSYPICEDNHDDSPGGSFITDSVPPLVTPPSSIVNSHHTSSSTNRWST